MTPERRAAEPLAHTGCAEGPDYGHSPDLALAAVLQLLSRFPARRSPAVARAIAAHLALIGGDTRMPESVRECAARLVSDWRAYEVLGESWSAAECPGHLQ